MFSQKQRNGVSYHCRAGRGIRHTTNSKRGYHKDDQLVDRETARKKTTGGCRPKSHRDAMNVEMETKSNEKDEKAQIRLISGVREKCEVADEVKKARARDHASPDAAACGRDHVLRYQREIQTADNIPKSGVDVSGWTS